MKSQDVKLLMQHNVTLYFQGERRRLMHRCCPSVRSSVRLSVAKIRIQKSDFLKTFISCAASWCEI